jgi:hypothetical protein
VKDLDKNVYKIDDLVEMYMSPQDQPAGEDLSAGREVLVWMKNTWGSYGQHSNLYTFVISLDDLSQKTIFECVTVRHDNRDSSKNAHRYAYATIRDILSLNNCVIKVVSDYASSRRRVIDVRYYYIQDGKVRELYATKGLRDNEGFFDEVKLPNNKRLIVRKNGLVIV